jgi:putative peptide zinc metalloprotease protein
VRALAIAAVGLPILGIAYILLRLVRQLTTGVWQRTRGKTLQRAVAMAAIAAVTAGLAWAWWPGADTYRPVQPYERGTLADVTTAVFPTAAYSALREGATGNTVALWPAGAAKPTREDPQLSMVLVPRTGPTGAGTAAGTTAGSAPAPSWVFPFNQPAAPEQDGNQALAVNTTDGSVAYDVAFALVWAEDGEPVDTTNEAYAFASCADCAAVAVGFQVVLIVGQADVIVPENLSAAANYNCLRCLTYALASQLVLTLDGPLSDGGTARLNALWAEIAEFGRNLQNVPLSEIQGRLNAFREQIKEIIQSDPSATRSAGTATPPITATPSPGSTPGSGQSAFPGVTAPASVPSGTTTAVPPPAAPATGGAAPESSPAQEAPTTEPANIAPVTPTPVPTTTTG